MSAAQDIGFKNAVDSHFQGSRRARGRLRYRSMALEAAANVPSALPVVLHEDQVPKFEIALAVSIFGRTLAHGHISRLGRREALSKGRKGLCRPSPRNCLFHPSA